MRVFYIVAMVLGLLFFIAAVSGTGGRTSTQRNHPYDYDSYLNEYDSALRAYAERSQSESAETAVGIALVYFAFCVALYVATLIAIKSTLARVCASIGLVLTLAMSILATHMMDHPKRISPHEVYGVWVLYSLITLVLAIIGTTEAFRYIKRERAAQTAHHRSQYAHPYPAYAPHDYTHQAPYSLPPRPLTRARS